MSVKGLMELTTFKNLKDNIKKHSALFHYVIILFNLMSFFFIPIIVMNIINFHVFIKFVVGILNPLP